MGTAQRASRKALVNLGAYDRIVGSDIYTTSISDNHVGISESDIYRTGAVSTDFEVSPCKCYENVGACRGAGISIAGHHRVGIRQMRHSLLAVPGKCHRETVQI